MKKISIVFQKALFPVLILSACTNVENVPVDPRDNNERLEKIFWHPCAEQFGKNKLPLYLRTADDLVQSAMLNSINEEQASMIQKLLPAAKNQIAKVLNLKPKDIEDFKNWRSKFVGAIEGPQKTKQKNIKKQIDTQLTGALLQSIGYGGESNFMTPNNVLSILMSQSDNKGLQLLRPLLPYLPFLAQQIDIKIMGYYGTGAFGLEHSLNPEMLSHSNMIFAATDVQIIKVHMAAKRKVIYMLAHYFPYKAESGPEWTSWQRGNLHPNWRKMWIETEKEIKSNNLEPGIAMFYIYDEPYLHFPIKLVYEGMDTLTQKTKEVFPNIPNGIIVELISVNGYAQFPKGVDWIGYDCYGDLDHCGGFRSEVPKELWSGVFGEKPASSSGAIENSSEPFSYGSSASPGALPGFDKKLPSIDETLCTLISKMQPHQRLMLVPQAFTNNFGEDYYATEDELIRRWERTMKIAESPFYPVAAIIPFLWDCPTCEGALGPDPRFMVPGSWPRKPARDLPKLRAKIKEFYDRVVKPHNR